MIAKKSILFALLILLTANAAAVAVCDGTTVHKVDGTAISNGQNVYTENSFEYKVVFTNCTGAAKYYEIVETISNKLTLESCSETYDTTTAGDFKQYNIHGFLVPANSSSTVTMVFKNNTTEAQETASINVSYRDLGDGIWDDFSVFVFKANVPAIPEFSFAAIPIGIVLGTFFLINRKKRTE